MIGSRAWLYLALILVVAPLLASCAPSTASSLKAAATATLVPTATLQPRPTATKPAQRIAPPKEGAQATEFTLTNLDGEEVSLQDLRGKKVMLNFWATWCGPCQLEIPHMVKLYDEFHEQGLEILAINVAEDPALVSAFVSDFGMQFPVLLDTTAKVARAYYVRGIPASFFIDEAGVIQTIHIGTLSEKVLRQYLDELMG